MKTRFARLFLLGVLIPALAWGLVGKEAKQYFDGVDTEPLYYQQVSGSAILYVPTEQDAKDMIELMESEGYYGCRYYDVSFGPGTSNLGYGREHWPESATRFHVFCNWFLGEAEE